MDNELTVIPETSDEVQYVEVRVPDFDEGEDDGETV